MTYLRTFASVAAAGLLSTAASAATFDFTGYSDGGQEELTQTVDGISVSVTAGVYGDDGSAFFVPDWDGLSGFGLTLGDLVVSTQDGSGFFSGDSGIGVALASIPTAGPDVGGAIDLLTFTFDRVVEFSSIGFGNVDGDDDVDIFVDGQLVAPSDRNIASSGNPLDLTGLTGTSLSVGADDLFLLFVDHTPTDNFNVQSLTVSAVVPLPAAGLLLIGAMGGFAALRRKRSAS